MWKGFFTHAVVESGQGRPRGRQSHAPELRRRGGRRSNLGLPEEGREAASDGGAVHTGKTLRARELGVLLHHPGGLNEILALFDQLPSPELKTDASWTSVRATGGRTVIGTPPLHGAQWLVPHGERIPPYHADTATDPSVSRGAKYNVRAFPATESSSADRPGGSRAWRAGVASAPLSPLAQPLSF